MDEALLFILGFLLCDLSTNKIKKNASKQIHYDYLKKAFGAVRLDWESRSMNQA